jgi:hypothetical protein
MLFQYLNEQKYSNYSGNCRSDLPGFFVQGELIEIRLEKKLRDSKEKACPGVVFGAAEADQGRKVMGQLACACRSYKVSSSSKYNIECGKSEFYFKLFSKMK